MRECDASPCNFLSQRKDGAHRKKITQGWNRLKKIHLEHFMILSQESTEIHSRYAYVHEDKNQCSMTREEASYAWRKELSLQQLISPGNRETTKQGNLFSGMSPNVREEMMPHNPVFFRKMLQRSNAFTRGPSILLSIQQNTNEIKLKVHKSTQSEHFKMLLSTSFWPMAS